MTDSLVYVYSVLPQPVDSEILGIDGAVVRWIHGDGVAAAVSDVPAEQFDQEPLNANVRGQSLYRTLVYLPVIVPSVVMALLWLWIFNPDYGLLNGVLAAVHLPPGSWLASPDQSKNALLIMVLWGTVGSVMVVPTVTPWSVSGPGGYPPVTTWLLPALPSMVRPPLVASRVIVSSVLEAPTE